MWTVLEAHFSCFSNWSGISLCIWRPFLLLFSDQLLQGVHLALRWRPKSKEFELSIIRKERLLNFMEQLRCSLHLLNLINTVLNSFHWMYRAHANGLSSEGDIISKIVSVSILRRLPTDVLVIKEKLVTVSDCMTKRWWSSTNFDYSSYHLVFSHALSSNFSKELVQIWWVSILSTL